jgi:DNA helicase-2/ATP-dependent DNA helicase PcrA
MFSISHLNKKQKQAVVWGKGPLLIIAGAGTGKTTVITHRIAYLIEKKKAKPEEILGLTFTDKAAKEMLIRVDGLLSEGYADLWISTFHSFCDRVLRQEGLHIGLPTDFKLLDETQSWLLLRRNLQKLKLRYYQPLGSPTKFLRALISHFNRCKDQMISPEDYLNYAQKTKDKAEKERLLEIALAFQEYQKLLLDSGFLDFGDLINYCLRLFKERPKVLAKYRQQFKYILVDEFQDTNRAQYELIKLLAALGNDNLTVCGDDFQAIYRWRGASWGNLIQFKKDFSKAKEITLLENYRSRQNILDLAYKFIKLDDSSRPDWLNRISKKLKSIKRGAGEIKHLHFKTVEEEVSAVVAKIAEILKEDKTATLGDFAVLVRANNQAASFARAFEMAGVPFQFLALKGLYSKPIILDIISYLKFLDNYHESSAAYRILNLPFLGISQEDIATITLSAARKVKSIFEIWGELSLLHVSEKTRLVVAKIMALSARHAKIASEKNVSEIVLAFLEDSGYLAYLVKKERKGDLDLIGQFCERIKAFEESHLDSGLRSFMEELSLELESGEEGKLDFDIEQGPDVVKIMTVHGAKGLEFNYVFLVNLVDKRFPSIERSDPIEIPEKLMKDILPKGDYHLQEERRLFYVALTRAKYGLFLTSAKDYGGVQAKRLSRFLLELGYSSQPLQIKPKAAKITKKSRPTKLVLPERFSFTQLIAFDKCPLQYKFAHILRIPVKARPVFSFGKTMHNALFEFMREAVLGKKLSLNRLTEIYQREWLDDWYESKTQKQAYFEQGKKSLKKFYEDFVEAKPKLFLISGQPALEQGFSIKIKGHTLIGKIDRIDEVSGGAELIDYKTGSVKEKLRPEDRKQLLIYQIAAKEALGLNPKKLTYYYLDEGKSLSFLGSDKDIKEEKEKIIKEIEQIKKSDFKATPGWQCDWCDFKDICEFARRT